MIRIKDFNIKIRPNMKSDVEKMQELRKNSTLDCRDFFISLSKGKLVNIGIDGKEIYMYRADQDEDRKDKYMPETFLQFYGKNGEFLFSFPWNGETILVPDERENMVERCSFGYEHYNPEVEIGSRNIFEVDLIVTTSGAIGIRSKESGYVSRPEEYGYFELDPRMNEVHRPCKNYETEVSGRENASYEGFNSSDRKNLNFGSKRWFIAFDRANEEGRGDAFLKYSMEKGESQK